MLSEEELNLRKRQSAKKLSELMMNNRPFSFLRMGDGELRWLLAVQEGDETKQNPHSGKYMIQKGAPVEFACGVRGLEKKDYNRLLRAYENCTYLDLMQNNDFNSRNLHRLKLEPSRNTYTEPKETSVIIFSWMNYEFKDYVANRRCLFASAESPLLEQLYQDERYRKLASDYWSNNAQPFFFRLRKDGRYYWQYLDEIKADLKNAIEKYEIDTLFLSLGTGAKILCYEIAEEMRIATFDWGAMARGLTYSGSYGYQASRASHHPYFFHIPFPIFMEALERAYPEMTTADLLSKAHAQLCLELQNKSLGQSITSEVYNSNLVKNTNANNRDIFWKAYRFYEKYYKPLSLGNPDAKELVKNFERYRLYRGMGIDGKFFQLIVKINKILKSILNH
jgi:hypothetical protein